MSERFLEDEACLMAEVSLILAIGDMREGNLEYGHFEAPPAVGV
jgi:hypothetical protein